MMENTKGGGYEESGFLIHCGWENGSVIPKELNVHFPYDLLTVLPGSQQNQREHTCMQRLISAYAQGSVPKRQCIEAFHMHKMHQ